MMDSANLKYYNVYDDIRNYPDAVILISYSRRGVGKTYGALWGAYQQKAPIIYIKRTISDIDLICSGSKVAGFDTSPYVPINRDHGTNIKPKRIANGIGAFYECDSDDEPIGNPVAYAVALSAIKNIKGIDLSHCIYMIFDEFIPQTSEMIRGVSSLEGESLLDVYMTVSRDREKRGFDPLKLLLFANAENIYCPVVDELQIMDDIAALAISGNSIRYVPDRRILIHHVNEIELTEDETHGIYQVMKGTKWFRKSFGGEFSNNDFSNVSKQMLKGYSPLIQMHYRESDIYIYSKDGYYYICKIASNRCPIKLDLNRDNHVRKFYIKYCMDIQDACIDGKVKFSDYSLYDLIMNFDKRFKSIL